MNSNKASLWRLFCLFFVMVFLVFGCSGENDDGSSQDTSDQTIQFSIGMSSLKKQVTTNSISAMLSSFLASDVYTGQLLVTNTATLDSETHFWSVYVDDETFAVQSNKTIVLKPGEYEISLLVERGDQQYAGTALATIADGTNNVNLTLRPIIGDSILNVGVVSTLADFKFSYSPIEMAGIVAPHMGIIVDSGSETLYAINPTTGISDSYVNLSSGSHNVQLRLYDAAIQIGKSIPAQEDVIVVAGLPLQFDIVPLHGEMALGLSEEGGDANFTFTFPGEIVDEAGGLADLKVIFKSAGPTNPYQETTLTVVDTSGDYSSSATINNFQFGTINLSLEFYDDSDSELIAICSVSSVVNSTAKTLACGVDLHVRSIISGNLMGVVGLNVFDTDSQAVNGALVYEGSNLLGMTGSGPFGTQGYLKLFMIGGSHTLRAEDATHYGEALVAVPVLDEVNPDIFLENPLGTSTIITFSGGVIDAPVAFSQVTLVDYATINSTVSVIAGPVLTDENGQYSMVADLTAVDATTDLALIVSGRQKIPGGLVPDCSTSPQDSYVDIDKNGSYDTSTDACLGEKLSFISILGTKDNVAAVGLQNTGIIDTANMPELIVTHVTTAEALVLDPYIGGSGAIDAYAASFETALQFEAQLQQQVAVIGALYRAVNHEIDFSVEAPLLWAELGLVGIDTLIDNIISGAFVIDVAELPFLESIIAADDSLALPGLMTVASDLSGVDFTITNPTVSATDPLAFAALNAKFELLMDDFIAALLQTPPILGTSSFTANYCPNFLHNGENGDQHTAQYVEMVNSGIPEAGGFITTAGHSGSHLVRHADSGGLVYYDPLLDEFTYSASGNYPVYRKKGVLTAEFPLQTYTFSIDDPQMEMEGYVAEDGVGDLCELGNRVKFGIDFRARNEQGRREIELFIDDEDHGTPGERFYINSVQVDVADDAFATLPSSIPWPDGGGEFRTDCTLAEAQVQNDPMNTYQCLNLFVLFFNDWNEDDDFWGADSGPWYSSNIEHSFVIPLEWLPDQYTTFTITVNYYDTVNDVTSDEIYIKSFRLFPTDEYLAKLLYDNLNAAHLVDGSDLHPIGDNNGLSLNWRFRDTDVSPEPTFPEDAQVEVDLWDPVAEVDIPGFEAQLEANQHSVELTGDLSAYNYLILSIQLTLADESRANAEYQLVKNAADNWIAYPFGRVALREVNYTHDNKIAATVETGEYNHIELSSAYGRIAPAVSFELFDYDPSGPYSFAFRDYNYWVGVNGGGYRLDFVEDGASPHTDITYTPDYNSISSSFSYVKLFDAIPNHQVQNLDVSHDIATNRAIVTWNPPLDMTGMTPYDRTAYNVYFSFNDSTNDYEDFNLNDTLEYQSEILPITNPATDYIRVEVRAIHYDWLVEGSYELVCTADQIDAGNCHQ